MINYEKNIIKKNNINNKLNKKRYNNLLKIIKRFIIY